LRVRTAILGAISYNLTGDQPFVVNVMVPTSLSLLERLRTQADNGAWQRLVEIYRPWILGWLCRHGLGECDAEDLAQEILLVVVRELPYFQHNQRTGAFRNWLRQIVVHRLQDFFRSKRYRPQAGRDSSFWESLNQLDDGNSVLSRLWNQEHDRHVVRRLMALIEPDFQQITWQAFCGQMLDGESPATVAAKLGISVNAALLAKSRILARLRQEGQALLDMD
jgi:RNA polymerase sigma factor (sigma-70 family)